MLQAYCRTLIGGNGGSADESMTGACDRPVGIAGGGNGMSMDGIGGATGGMASSPVVGRVNCVRVAT